VNVVHTVPVLFATLKDLLLHTIDDVVLRGEATCLLFREDDEQLTAGGPAIAAVGGSGLCGRSGVTLQWPRCQKHI